MFWAVVAHEIQPKSWKRFCHARNSTKIVNRMIWAFAYSTKTVKTNALSFHHARNSTKIVETLSPCTRFNPRRGNAFAKHEIQPTSWKRFRQARDSTHVVETLSPSTRFNPRRGLSDRWELAIILVWRQHSIYFLLFACKWAIFTQWYNYQSCCLITGLMSPGTFIVHVSLVRKWPVYEACRSTWVCMYLLNYCVYMWFLDWS